MQVSALQLFLRSLAPALEAAGDGSAARALDEASRSLQPFHALPIGEFAAFLHRAEDYRRTGTVQVPGGGELAAEAVLKALRGFDRALQLGQGLAAAQEQIAHALEGLARQTGLKGALTADSKWVAAQELRARIAPHKRELLDLAARITSPDVYGDEAIRERLARLEAVIDRDTLKALGAEFGVSVTAKTAIGKALTNMLAKLSGHQAPKVKATKAKARTAPVDPALVEENARRLGDLIARSDDPRAISDAEIETEIGILKKLPNSALYEVITRAGIEGARSRDSADAMLLRVRNRLTATRRAFERTDV